MTPRQLKIKMIMTFVYPVVTYGCQGWCLDTDAKKTLDVWWMKLMRRVRGINITDRLRNVKILEELQTPMLSEMIEERQLRYLGHSWRYGENRWTKYTLQAARPGQTRTGRQLQLRKHISKLLCQKNLTLGDAANAEGWAKKLVETYPRGKGRKAGEERTPGENGEER
jgi:hypothetical protein